MASMSGWLLLSVLSGLLLHASEVLLVGYILGPSAAGVYAATGLLVRLSTDVTSQLLGSGLPGLAGLCGRGEWARVAALRREMHLVTTVVAAIIGVAAILLNKPTMELWLGGGMYGGHLTNALMVAGALAATIYRIDAAVADAMLEFKLKAALMAGAGALGVIAAAWCAPRYGMPGVALSMLIARFAVVLILPMSLRRGTGIAFENPFLAAPRLVGTTVALLIVAAGTAAWSDASSRSSLALCAGVSLIGTPAVLWRAGLNAEEREQVWRRCDRLWMHITARLGVLVASPGAAVTRTS
jgi:O-antigen/teichoic acid export membrane protein